ncbi:MAG: helix-turn-helix transcriptional regulator [Acidobacteria bacterium]|nr:helix-turn-helix transcriptional regulator [Acidobacteriota bacterium]
MKLQAAQQREYREIKHSQVMAGFTITEAVYGLNLSVSRHSHRLACFGFVLQGAYLESYGKKALECKPLHLKFRPAGEVHADWYGEPAVRCFFIEPEETWLGVMREHSVKLSEPSVFYSNSLVCLMMKLRREVQRADALSPLVVEGLMLEVVAEASRLKGSAAVGQHPYWLKQVRDILHDRFNERLTLSEIGKSVGMHPVHLASVFRRHYRCTIGEYLRQLRIEFACREISMTDAPLAQIALAAGFSHQSPFTRTFKRVTGVTPARYRSTNRA